MTVPAPLAYMIVFCIMMVFMFGAYKIGYRDGQKDMK